MLFYRIFFWLYCYFGFGFRFLGQIIHLDPQMYKPAAAMKNKISPAVNIWSVSIFIPFLVNQPRWLGGETTRARSEAVKGEEPTTRSARQIDASTCCEMFGRDMCSQFERYLQLVWLIMQNMCRSVISLWDTHESVPVLHKVMELIWCKDLWLLMTNRKF